MRLRAVAHGVKRKRVRRAVKEEVDETFRQIVGGTDASGCCRRMNAAEVRQQAAQSSKKEAIVSTSLSIFITRLSRAFEKEENGEERQRRGEAKKM